MIVMHERFMNELPPLFLGEPEMVETCEHL